VEDRRKENEMTKPLTLPPMDEVTLTELHRRDAGKPRCRNAHALPDALTLAARPEVESDCPHGVTQSGYRGACIQPVLGGRIGCGASAHGPRSYANGHSRLGSRTGARDRAGSSWSGTGHGQLDHRAISPVLRPAHGYSGDAGDGAPVLACP
jgi:hypothetical protein